MADPQKTEAGEGLGPQDTANDSMPHGTIRRQLMGDWFLLHPNIRARFERDPKPGEHVVYDGLMDEIRCSRMGALFAFLTRVIGNPLTSHEGKNVPMRVQLTKSMSRRGVTWERTYFFENKKPAVIRSVKIENEKGELMECVGGGFGMVLDVYTKDGSLHFESTHYFWSILGKRIVFPQWLAPGKTHVVHEDLGEGNFRFTITMKHDVLGETFYQTGVFKRLYDLPSP